MPDKPISEGKSVIVDKKVGETPLEAIERFRAGHADDTGHPEYATLPMTYAGRLDPMAEGKLLILIGDECKNKEKYLRLDKEYEVEILFGVDTDTHDVLGRISKVGTFVMDGTALQKNLKKYVGRFEQEYPAFSSKTVGGKAMHVHARAGTLPENFESSDWPKKSVEIYAIEVLHEGTRVGRAVAHEAIEKIGQLKEKAEGDFRKKEILADWHDFGKKYDEEVFAVMKIRVACSSGTYMRSLAKRIGDDTVDDEGEAAGNSSGAIAFSIHRTKIGD